MFLCLTMNLDRSNGLHLGAPIGGGEAGINILENVAENLCLANLFFYLPICGKVQTIENPAQIEGTLGFIENYRDPVAPSLVGLRLNNG